MVNIRNGQYKIIVIFIICLIVNSILVTFTSIRLEFLAFCSLIFGILFLIYYFLDISKSKKIYIEDYLIWALMFFNLLSLINTKDLSIALLGMKSRYEGLLTLFTYYFLFLNTIRINKNKQNNIIKLILIYGFINVIIGLLQVISNWTLLFNITGSWYNAKGLLGNSNFYGALMVMDYLIVFGMYQKNFQKKELILLIIFSIGVIISGCLSAYLAIIIVLIFTFIYNIIKNKREVKNIRTYYPFILLIILYLLFANFLIETLNKDILGIGKDINSIVNNTASTTVGSSRIYIWNNMLKYFPKTLPFGIGPDNIYFINNGQPICNFLRTECFDKAHNEFLQILLTEGVGSLMVYLVLIFSIFLNNIIKINRKEIYILFLPFVGYLIQSFFNISTIRVTPIFFILMGLLVSKGMNNND
jgi:hypothetical protein